MRRGLFLAAAAMIVLPGAALAQPDDFEWAADQYYGDAEMAEARHHLHEHNGDQTFWFVQGERLEYQFSDDEPVILFDGQGWVGGDVNRFWVKSEIEYLPDENETEAADIQALYSRAISPFFDAQVGLRQDIEPDGETYGVIGLQGLAPYRFELDTAAFLSSQGDLTGAVEAEYELLFTQRLILQPSAELLFAAQDVPEKDIRSGLSSAELGLRLRYEIRREFAPYIGVSWEKSFADFDNGPQADEDSDEARLLAGIRFWF